MLLYPDGRTPATNTLVRVWSVEKKRFVCQTLTNQKGRYKLPKLEPGRYISACGDHVRADILVVAASQRATRYLNFIVPRDMPPVAVSLLETEFAAEVEPVISYRTSPGKGLSDRR